MEDSAVVLIHVKPCLALWYQLGWLVDLRGWSIKKGSLYSGVFVVCS